MLIRATGVIRHDAEVIEPGREVNVPDQRAFEIIRQGFAEPASRRAHRVYSAMKKAYEASLPKPGPDIRDQFVSAPKIEYTHPIRGGLIARINPFN